MRGKDVADAGAVVLIGLLMPVISISIAVYMLFDKWERSHELPDPPARSQAATAE